MKSIFALLLASSAAFGMSDTATLLHDADSHCVYFMTEERGYKFFCLTDDRTKIQTKAGEVFIDEFFTRDGLNKALVAAGLHPLNEGEQIEFSFRIGMLGCPLGVFPK